MRNPYHCPTELSERKRDFLIYNQKHIRYLSTMLPLLDQREGIGEAEHAGGITEERDRIGKAEHAGGITKERDRIPSMPGASACRGHPH